MYLITLTNVYNIKIFIPNPIIYSITTYSKYSKARFIKKWCENVCIYNLLVREPKNEFDWLKSVHKENFTNKICLVKSIVTQTLSLFLKLLFTCKFIKIYYSIQS